MRQFPTWILDKPDCFVFPVTDLNTIMAKGTKIEKKAVKPCHQGLC